MEVSVPLHGGVGALGQGQQTTAHRPNPAARCSCKQSVIHHSRTQPSMYGLGLLSHCLECLDQGSAGSSVKDQMVTWGLAGRPVSVVTTPRCPCLGSGRRCRQVTYVPQRDGASSQGTLSCPAHHSLPRMSQACLSRLSDALQEVMSPPPCPPEPGDILVLPSSAFLRLPVAVMIALPSSPHC